MRFTGICLLTKNVPLMAEFYKKVLGVEGEGDDVHVELKTEGGAIAIFSEAGMEKVAPGCMQGAGTGSYTIGFMVPDVDAEYERLKKLNVEFLGPPISKWGCRTLWFRDPDRNIINFYCTLNQQ